MLKNLKIKAKLFFGFGMLIMFSGLFSIYSIQQFDLLSDLSREIEEAEKITTTALALSTEFYHTQLEIWEYLYIPDQTRFQAYKSHDEHLTTILTELVEQIASESEERSVEKEISSLGLEAEELSKKVVVSLGEVRVGWYDDLIPAIKKIEVSIEEGGSEEIINDLKAAAVPIAIANESIFDDSTVEELALAQSDRTRELAADQEIVISRIKNIGLFLTVVLFIVGVIIAFWISSVIARSIIEVRNVAVEIAQGNMDIEIDISGKDEIG
ncbi:cell wall metabolism sensor histidine kinase WalK, partial [Candidatus Pacebacteria bacterium]|nr:cell wall metabolism sensor histidine kinase WalK [Candidatus Paceibacterota bacterium]